MELSYSPKRGPLASLIENKDKLKNNELIYVTDINMLGVTNSVGEPQLLVEIIPYKTKDEFPLMPEVSNLFLSEEDSSVYYYDIPTENYEKISIIPDKYLKYYLKVK